jgi:hypothetical protein
MDRTRSSAVVLDRAEVLHRQVRDLHNDSASIRRSVLLSDLENRQQTAAARSGIELLSELGSSGFSWRDVSRFSKVSIPAVQKWRRGEGMTGANRLRLARLVAFLDLLRDHFISEPVSWLEMPVKDQVQLSRLQMLINDRFDLVLELVSDDGDPVAVEPILDEYDSSWRETLVDPAFETFVATDGSVAIRPRT